MARRWTIVGMSVVAAAAVLGAQEREDRTLLTQDQMTAIINEASGERAYHNVLEQVPYQFVRPPSEYQGHFREAVAVERMAKEYGFSNVTIEDYPTGQTWQPVVGELWMTDAARARSSTTSTTFPSRSRPPTRTATSAASW